MSKIWFCRNCGYEVTSRGRCHRCRARLAESPLRELAPGAEEDEVGYRLTDWADATRVDLIVGLIESNIPHRFEDDELVVGADDEARADDLVDEVTTAALARADEDPDGDEAPVLEEVDPALAEDLEILLGAAGKLATDPTDLAADTAVTEASGAVFVHEGHPAADAATWSAIGRVTRRLLAALASEEALEDEISLQAAILIKLGQPLVVDVRDAAVAAATTGEDRADEVPGHEDAGDEDPGDDEPAPDDVEEPDPEGPTGSSYELPDWQPEQRAQLSVLLDRAGVAHAWEGGDLVVAEADEDAVEGLFDQVDGVASDEDDEARYRALESLFAASGRLVGDPASSNRRQELVRAAANIEGSTPVGIDDAKWLSIRSRARTLAELIEDEASGDAVHGEAENLRDLLRALV